jgi:hypothetical protein
VVAKNKEHFESAERFWAGTPSLAAVDAIVERMRARERERLEIYHPTPTPKDYPAFDTEHPTSTMLSSSADMGVGQEGML